MGAIPIVSDIASGVGALTGLYSAVDGAEYNDMALRVQQQENARNRQFQSDEAQKQRDFSQQQTDQLLGYNSAQQQVQRLQEAGVNPATAFSKGTGSAGSAMVASQGAVPAGSSGLNIPSYISPIQQMSLSGAYLASLADAYKTTNEGSVVHQKAEAEIGKLLSEMGLNEVHKQSIALGNVITAKTGLRKAEGEIKNLFADADLKIAQKAKTLADKNLSEAEYNIAVEKLTEQVYRNVQAEFEAIYGKNKWRMSEIDVRYHEAEITEGLKTLQSQQYKNTQEGNLAGANTRYQNMFNDVYDSVYHNGEFTEKMRSTVIQGLKAEGKLSDQQIQAADRMLEAIESLRGNKAIKALDNFFQLLGSSVMSGTGAAAVAGASKFIK